MGRPRKTVSDTLPPGWRERMFEMCKEGALEIELRAEFGLTTYLWYEWLEREPEFAETIGLCKILSEGYWTRVVADVARGRPIKGRGAEKAAHGNIVALIWLTKNAFGWRDQQELSVTARVIGEPLEQIGEQTSSEQWADRFVIDAEAKDVVSEPH